MIEHEIEMLHLPMAAVIGQIKLSIRDLLQLQRGDILCLDKKKETDLVLTIGGKAKMMGKTGLVGRKKAIEIVSIIEKEVPGSNE
jgi:flagellar motor switch protein FliM